MFKITKVDSECWGHYHGRSQRGSEGTTTIHKDSVYMPFDSTSLYLYINNRTFCNYNNKYLNWVNAASKVADNLKIQNNKEDWINKLVCKNLTMTFHPKTLAAALNTSLWTFKNTLRRQCTIKKTFHFTMISS